MRTLISLLLLVCFAVTQASAAGCPMASGPHGQAESEAASASTHHGHHAPAPDWHDHGQEHAPSPAHHVGAACVLMACGSTAVPPLALALDLRDAPASDGLAGGRGSYASPSLSTEPPPPRGALRS
jgi:hypothetical protein